MAGYTLEDITYHNQTLTVDAVSNRDGKAVQLTFDLHDETHASCIARAAAGILELAIQRAHDIERASKL